MQPSLNCYMRRNAAISSRCTNVELRLALQFFYTVAGRFFDSVVMALITENGHRLITTPGIARIERV